MKNKDTVKMLRDPKFYLENFCKIKGKKPGKLIPFILNEAQKDLFNTVRRNPRVMILKARQMGFCLDKNTKVLSSDLRWILLKDIIVGQEIIAVDEYAKNGRGNGRKMRRSVVEAKRTVHEEAFELRLDNGGILIATKNHKFLSKKWNTSSETYWRTVENTSVGNEIRHITQPWDSPSYEDGWISGMIDGEGSMAKKTRSGASITISQIEGDVWERLKKYFTLRKYNFRIEWDKRTPENSSKRGINPVGKIVIGRMNEIFKIIGQTRPSRMIDRKWWDGKDLPGKCSGDAWAKVMSIKSLGKREMIDLQTSCGTFIAEGFVSHNSTGMTGYFYHDTITTPGTTTALIGYNSDLTAELLDKVKTFYKSTPEQLRPTIHYNSKYEISFPAIDSKILVLPSTENVGRGYTINNCLATELSAWDKADEKMMTLEASVPINGKLVIESTPRGQGNLYHRMWMGDNDYTKNEYGWWWGYNEEEIEIIRRRMNNPRKFAQEYGLGFLASGRSVFDVSMLEKLRDNVLKIGDVVTNEDGTTHTVYGDNGMVYYKKPDKERFYVCGADVSEGVDGGDYSVATFWDRKTGEEVAQYRGLLAPDLFGNKLNEWGRQFNNALMVVEVNNHGLTTLTILKQLLYPTLYFRQAKFESLGMTSSDKMGWKTTKMTRPLLIDDFAQACRDGALLIHSKELVDEMSVFIYDDNGNMTPQSGFHDDCIFSAAIGFQGFKVMYHEKLSQLNYEQHLPESFAY